MLALLGLYPSWWRRRYGEEAAAILDHSSPSLRAALDLLRGAVDAWTRQRPPDEGFAHFTDEARLVVDLAQREARALHHNYLGTEHILLGLLVAGEGGAARSLTALGLTAEQVRSRLIQVVGLGGPPPGATCSRPWRRSSLPDGSFCVTPRAKHGFELARLEADRLGATGVGPDDLLMGLIGEREGLAVRIMSDLGADPERLRRLTDRPAKPPHDPA
jgi:ATP-dependent Clp protease ATP-binding subunit ClpA